jgi:rhomboid family GlyGly-CTERM serine protease
LAVSSPKLIECENDMKTVTIHKNISYDGSSLFKEMARSFELCAWLMLLLFCNHTLFFGQMADHFVFVPSLVKSGEWYRAVISPFVHVSLYHLILDAGAFLFLWKMIDEDDSRKRWIYLVTCWAGSLLVPLLASEGVYQLGLCGLSGIAHGLFAVAALELTTMSHLRQARPVGFALFTGLLAKVVWEVVTGGAFLAGMHLGPVGTPIVSSHLGGLIGGSLGFAAIRMVCILNNVNRSCGGAPS